MSRLHKTEALPAVRMTVFEAPLSEEESAIEHSVHRLAREGQTNRLH
ncbi:MULTISPECIES: hypothetical protein [Cupriavidus]|nr:MULTISPECIES: hypothetical protein [Cupriavidus]QQX89360.1 hypothetical protein JJQ59_38165 [Cupriavidus necator]